MNNVRFSTAVHILTLLATAKPDQWTSSEYLAGSVNTNPALIRKEIGSLRRAGLVESREGKNGGSRLAKKAADISMAEVYESVRQSFLLGKMNEPNPKCPVGREINRHLRQLYEQAERQFAEQFGRMTLDDFSRQFG
ncbi:MAG: Rrf2 family transcriptional regulator [Mucilaginibacter polytrichastri]|nr:Rrf2 family transcriptional regulator [Mucilaginibacter polytrichastri]